MYYDKLNSWKADNYAYDWDNKSPALHVLLTQIFPSEMMKVSSPSSLHVLASRLRSCAQLLGGMKLHQALRWHPARSIVCCPH